MKTAPGKPILFAAVLAFFIGAFAQAGPDGPKIIVKSHDGHLEIVKPYDKRYPAQLIRVSTGEVLQTFPVGMDLYSFAFSVDDRLLAAQPDLVNLGTTGPGINSKKAAPVYVFEVNSGKKIRTLDFGKQLLPKGNAVLNFASSKLQWSPNGQFISVDLESGRGVGIVLDAATGDVCGTFGTISPSVRYTTGASLSWLEHIRTLWPSEWRTHGKPISSMLWNPNKPAEIAVADHEGSVAIVDMDSIFPSGAKAVKMPGKAIGRAKAAQPSDRFIKMDPKQVVVSWSPDGRYLATIQDTNGFKFTYKTQIRNPDADLRTEVAIYDTQAQKVVRKEALHFKAKKNEFDNWRYGEENLSFNWGKDGTLRAYHEDKELLKWHFEMGPTAESFEPCLLSQMRHLPEM